MTPESFLQELLKAQDLSSEDEQVLQAHKKEITDFLRAEFGDQPQIKYAGSYAKGTMITEQYDLDIVCYFPSSDTRSLKEIREDVSAHLKNKYATHPKASAERIMSLKGVNTPSDYHIDVVPGRFIQNTKDVFLHVGSGEKERIQTNLKTHIDHIANSGCAPVIRLAKLWARRNNLQIRTFVLELFVIHTLTGTQNKDNLQKSFIKVLEGFRDEFETLQLIDPANSNNVVSQLVDPVQKALTIYAAKEALNKIGKSEDTANWKTVFHDDERKRASLAAAIVRNNTTPRSFAPPSPWCSTN